MAAHLSILYTVLWLLDIANSQSMNCAQFNTENECLNAPLCQWVTETNNFCQCASMVALDVLIGIDASGSLSTTDWQNQKEYVKMITRSLINKDVSQIGFTLFSTGVTISAPIQSWSSQSDIDLHIDNLTHTRGYTDTKALLNSAITQFEAINSPGQSLLLMITDGTPCIQGECPQSIAQTASFLQTADIDVVIVAVGGNYNPQYFDPLLSDVDNVLLDIASYTNPDFDSSLPQLFPLLCPGARELIITEIKPDKNSWNYRYNRFIEIYNVGSSFDAHELVLSGVLTGQAPSGTTISRGQYLVFYDATNIIDTGADVTCHLCDPLVCDLTQCTDAGDQLYTGTCHCNNAVYVPCGNTQTPGTDDVALCMFDDAVGNTGWSVTIKDSFNNTLDQVIYDSSWITALSGYSYELISKDYDNSVGSNWAQGCMSFGTPGADIIYACPTLCDATSCGAGNICQLNGKCQCTGDYEYPFCQDAQTCNMCRAILSIDDCEVSFIGGTNAEFLWTDSATGESKQYQLTYYTAIGSNNLSINNALFQPVADYDLQANISYGGYVKRVVNNCFTECISYYSAKMLCNVIIDTTDPTTTPTETTQIPTTTPVVYTSTTQADITTQTVTTTSVTTTAAETTQEPVFEECVGEFLLNNGMLGVKMDIDLNLKKMQITIRGPANKWFGIGFGQHLMTNTYAIIVSDDRVVKERKLSNHNKGTSLIDTFDSIEATDGAINERVVILVRDFKILGNANIYDFTQFFLCNTTKLNIIWAVGATLDFGYHGNNKGNLTSLISCLCPTDQPTNTQTDAPAYGITEDSIAPTTKPTNNPTVDVLGGNKASHKMLNTLVLVCLVILCCKIF